MGTDKTENCIEKGDWIGRRRAILCCFSFFVLFDRVVIIIMIVALPSPSVSVFGYCIMRMFLALHTVCVLRSALRGIVETLGREREQAAAQEDYQFTIQEEKKVGQGLWMLGHWGSEGC